MRRFTTASILGCTALVGFAVAAPAMSDEPAQATAAPAASVSLTYIGEVWNVASGGLDQGSVYLDNIDLQASLDLERLIGWNGANAFAYALYANGNSVAERVGDLNGISNNETGEALRLVEAWIDQGFAAGRGSLRLGLYDLSSEFDAGEVRALFMNPAHGIGTDYSQSGVNGPSIWPITSLALRVNYEFEHDVYLRAAIADGVPGNPDFPKRTTIDFEDGDGVLLAAEAGIAREGRLWSLGAWTYSGKFPDLVTGQDRTNAGAYVALEEALVTAAAGNDFDLSGSLRFGMANGDVNPVESFFSATLVATGLLPARPEDQLGLGLIVIDASSGYLAGLADPADREINIELTYFAQLTEEIALQPDVQCIMSPAVDGGIEDTLVFGLRLSVGRTWEIR
jgi:porin